MICITTALRRGCPSLTGPLLFVRMDQPNTSGSWMARARGCLISKTVPVCPHFGISWAQYHHAPPTLLFVWNYFRARNKLSRPEVRSSRQLDGFYNTLSLRVWLGGARFCWEATKRPRLGEAAAPFPPPFLAWRLKIGVSASPLPAPSPGTRVGPLAHSEQGKGSLSETPSASSTHAELVTSLVNAGPSPGLHSTLEVPRESRRKEKPTK